MKTNQRGQVLIVVAILLMVVLFFLAVVIDGARLMVERHELNRAADAAARAGLAMVGDRMVTQVEYKQTLAATNFNTPIFEENTPTPGGPTFTPTYTPTPSPEDFFAWMDDEDRAALVAPNMQTAVADQALTYAEKNALGLSNPDVVELKIIYPYDYYPGDSDLRIYVCIRRQVAILLVSILGVEEGEISGDTLQSIPQR